MATHTIEPERRTLHGHFSRDLEPVLTIDPGDTVCYRTLDAGWNLEPRTSTVESERPRKFEPRDQERDNGHALCGPIAIRGAEPGMTLAVQIKDVRPGAWGWTASGGWHTPLNERLGVVEDGTFLLWDLDVDRMIGHNQHGHTIGLRPFMGVLGMPPAAPGLHPTAPPRVTGGNIDCKELTAGSTLYLPIAVPGGLFSVGDGHAAQGDGEVSVTAIECPMERVELAFDLLPDLRLTTPRADTPAGWITFGFHQDLHEAMALALEAMLELMQERYGLSRHVALGMASVLVDLRITQVVNAGMLGVHAVLPHSAIR
ncbi:MAG TPA: acetamidase/formamidase family protein [Herpetosiphonaceae bacterium]